MASCLAEPTDESAVRDAMPEGGMLTLLSAVSAALGPTGYWEGFTAKIWGHYDSFSPWRVGFKHLFARLG